MDITEKPESQLAVSGIKALFEGIFAIAEDAIISVDSNQIIHLFNQSAEKAFGYDRDIKIVESILIEETTKAAVQVPGLLSDPSPSVRLTGFCASSLDLALTCSIEKFADQYLVQHELRKRILERFRKEKIDIPFPTRTIYMRDKSSQV